MKAAYYQGEKTFSIGNTALTPLKAGEVRLTVAYCGICGTDVHIYHGNMDKRVNIPQVIGHEVSGIIREIGPEVEGFSVGEKVVVRPLNPQEPSPSDNGYTHIGKNLVFMGIDSPGGMQSTWTVPAFTLHKLPQHVSLQYGAMMEPLAVACHDVRLSKLGAGETVVVIGGGPIGILIALVAKQEGAHVIVSEVNTSRLALIKSLGFEAVNPLEENLVARVRDFTNHAMADVVFEVSGTSSGVEIMTGLLKIRGRIVIVAIHPTTRQVDLFKIFWQELQIIGVRVYEPEDFEKAIWLADKLPLEKLITRILPLEQIQDAFTEIDDNPQGLKYLLQCNEL